jgi:hypothetical protein
MKNENQKIAAQCWTDISARGPTLLAWPSSTAAQPAHAVWPARHHRRPRCSVPDGDCTGERRRLRRVRWGGVVLTRDGRQWRSRENNPVRRCSKAAAELLWPLRVSMRPVVGGGDGG